MRTSVYKGLLVLGDGVIFYLALALALVIRHPASFSLSYYRFHVGFFSLILPVCLAVNSILGLYDFRQIRDLTGILGESLLAFFYSFALSVAVYYFLGQAMLSPKTNLFLTLLIAFVLGVYWRRFWMSLSDTPAFATKTLFLGGNAVIGGIIDDLCSHRYNRFKVVSRDAILGRIGGGGEVLSGLVDLIVVAPEQMGADPADRQVLAAAMDNAVPVWTYTDFYEELHKKVPPYTINKDAWMLAHVLHRRNTFYTWVKNVNGFLLAGIGIVLLSPLLPLIALAIKLEDGGPVFYSQTRVGYLKRPFRLWKFRTMKAGADNTGYLWNTAQADPRITGVGKFLRKFRLDELPQFWNILRGEMALVGPRPTWVGEKQALDLPDYHIRTLVKPGLTGWAQINSSATDSEADTFEKLCYDLYYIKNISFALDLSILLKTLRRVFQSEHSMRRKRRPPRVVPSVPSELQPVE